MIQTINDNELVKRNIQKKWNLDKCHQEVSQREDINEQVKDIKKISRYQKSNINHKSSRRKASGAEEETQRNRRDLPKDKNTTKKRKRKAKPVATVERQEHTLHAEIAQHTESTA